MPRAREPSPTAVPHPAEEPTGDLPYTIEHWDGACGAAAQVIARTLDLAVAEAMFSRAAAEYPAGATLLKQGERVLRRSGH